MQQLDAIKAQLASEPDGQLSTTDPHARAMATSRPGSAVMRYNVQTVVDAKNHLIVAHEVTNDSSDRAQLSKMAVVSREAMGVTELHAIADRGYYNGVELKACEDEGIAALVPKPMTSNAKAEGRFDKADFIYIARDDEYQCPAGQRAVHRFTTDERGQQIRLYWSSACPRCPMKEQCTISAYRRIRRWEHEAVMESVQRRLTHVGTEMSLHVLAYNWKCVMRILGIGPLMQAMKVMGA